MARTYSVAAPKLLTALLKFEVSQDYCREQGTLSGSEDGTTTVEIGTLLAQPWAGDVGAEAAAGNTGNGELTLANPSTGAGVVPGDYQVVIIEEAEDGGRFEVTGPDGAPVGAGAVGVAFAGPVKFALAAGDTDFKAGDSFAVTVPNDGETLVPWDPDATDGSAIVHAVSLTRKVVPEGDGGPLLTLRRGPAIVVAEAVEWPEGVTDDQKATALAALEAKGILAQ